MSLPNINKSSFSFIPDLQTNSILYGLKGITGVGEELATAIIANRPYLSIENFIEKIKPVFTSLNKTNLINLVKSGAFDCIYHDREKAINEYLLTSIKERKKLDLSSLGILIKNDLIPESFAEQIRVFKFNKHVKGLAYGAYYLFDAPSADFYFEKYGTDNVEPSPVERPGIEYSIRQKTWDKIYSSEMEPVKDFIKQYKTEMMIGLNQGAIQAEKSEYFQGSSSRWEMDSVGFYSEKHELDEVLYKFDCFSDLPEDPVVETIKRGKGGRATPIYKLNILAGTVLDKHKDKHSVTVLCGDDVVTVKIWRNQYAIYDKQVSERIDGKKKIIEKSWFKRGTKLVIVGIRRGDIFIPKTYYGSKWKKPIYKILNVENGEVTVQSERLGSE